MSLQPTARPAFLALVEEHLTSLVRSAVTVHRHCKRARLTPAAPTAGSGGDSNNNNNNSVVTASRLQASDINLALQLQGSEKLYGAQVMGGADPQQKISLQELLQQTSRRSDNNACGGSRAPTEVALRQQWLAVGGEVPEEGFGGTTPGHSRPRGGGGGASTLTTSLSTQQLPSNSLLRVHQLQANLLSEELKLYYHRVTTALEAVASPSNNAAAASDDNSPEQAAVDSVLARLATDRGLQELVPFFVLYAQQRMLGSLHGNGSSGSNSNGAAAAVAAVRLCRALLRNRHAHVELHLQELLPCWVTCIALPCTTANGSSGNVAAAHSYPLRQQAALAVAECLVRYGADYATLKPAVLKGLVQNTITAGGGGGGGGGGASSSQLMSRYGGWTAIALLGSRAIRAFLLPVAAVQWSEWERELNQLPAKNSSATGSGAAAAAVEQQLHMCQQALLQAVAKVQRFGDDPTLDAALREQLGDRTVAMARRPEYYYYNTNHDDDDDDDHGGVVVPEYHYCFV